MDFVSAPLGNSLFPFIDCDVKDEELRVIGTLKVDGRHSQSKIPVMGRRKEGKRFCAWML